MRILQLVHYFLPKHHAGVENYTYHLSKSLQKEHEVFVYCREDGYFDRDFYEEDLTYDGLNVRRIYYNKPLNFEAHYNNPQIDLAFERYIDFIKPDAVHIQHLERVSVGFIHNLRKRGIPVVLTLHDFWFMCPQINLLKDNAKICSHRYEKTKCLNCSGVVPTMIKYGILRRLNQMRTNNRLLGMFYETPFYRNIENYLLCNLSGVTIEQIKRRHEVLKNAMLECDYITAPSKFMQDEFNGHLFPNKGRVIFSSNGYNKKLFTEFKRESRLGKIRFGFIGSIMEHKGVDILVKAFSKIKSDNAELKIFGEGYDYFYEKFKKIASCDSRIKLMGPFNNNDIAKIHAQIDVLVVPSVWFENAPITVTEAILSHTPVIASRIGGITENILHGHNGLLFKASNAQDLACKMRHFIDNPTFIDEMGNNQDDNLVKGIDDNARELVSLYSSV